jgi:hypothetical protein
MVNCVFGNIRKIVKCCARYAELKRKLVTNFTEQEILKGKIGLN